MNNIKNTVYTKSGIKLMSISILIILVALLFFAWGLVRFILINPTKYVFNTSNRRHAKRAKKLEKLETKRQLKTFKEEVK